MKRLSLSLLVTLFLFSAVQAQWPQRNAVLLAPPDDELLFLWKPEDGVSAGIYSRASAGTYRDSSGTLQTAGTDVARTPHYVTANDSTEYRTFLHEPQRTNKLLYSEELDQSPWTTFNTSVTPNSDIAPDGLTTADSVVDNTSSFAFMHEDITIPNDSSSWTVSAFIKKDSDETRFPELGFDFQGGATEQEQSLSINTSTGASTLRVNEGGSASAAVISFNAEYWLAWVTAANNSSGNTTLRVNLIPAAGATLGAFDTSATGSCIYWGLQVENLSYRTSYIKTNSAAVSRAEDDLRFPIDFPPQELTVYVSFVSLAPPILQPDGSAVYYLGGNRNERTMRMQGFDYWTYWNHNGVATRSSTPGVSYAYWDKGESLHHLYSDGAIQAFNTKNGAPVVAGTKSASNEPLQSVWYENELHIGRRGPGLVGLFALRAIAIAKGIKTEEEMRSLAGE